NRQQAARGTERRNNQFQRNEDMIASPRVLQVRGQRCRAPFRDGWRWNGGGGEGEGGGNATGHSPSLKSQKERGAPVKRLLKAGHDCQTVPERGDEAGILDSVEEQSNLATVRPTE